MPNVNSAMLLILLFTLLVSCAPTTNNHDLIRLRQLKDQAYAGDSNSQYQLGLHYNLNRRWAWDDGRAHGWFLEAAEAGHSDAQYMVGINKLLGRGTAYDNKGAVRWFEKAALRGHAKSQYQLGQAYLNGNGIEKERPWGRHWLEQAALQEHRDAQFLLGALFNKGIGGQGNRPEAWRWLSRAKANQHPQADVALKNLARSISPPERSIGDGLTHQFNKPAANGLFHRPQVRFIQTALNLRGFLAGPEDGSMGPQTSAAIETYLRKKQLPRNTRADQLIELLRGSD